MNYARNDEEGIESFYLNSNLRSSLLESNIKGDIFSIFSAFNREKFQRIYMNLLEMDISKTKIISSLKEPNIPYLENMSEEFILDYLIERIEAKNEINIEEEEKSFENDQNLAENNDQIISISYENSNKRESSFLDFLSDDSENNMQNKLSRYSSSSLKFMGKIDDTFVCPVCWCQVAKFIEIPKCFHRFCEDCIFLYLKNIICTQAINLDDIKCPEEKCLNCFCSDFTEMIIEREETLLEKYRKFMKRSKMLRNPNIRECIRPNCEEYITKRFLTSKMKCKCGQVICFKCGYEWHGFRKCVDFSEEKFFNYQRKKNLKKCPMCRINIEKNEGCNHMTCLKCKYEFCWICNEEWNKTTGYCPNGCLKFPEYGRNFINLGNLQPENPLLSLKIWESIFYIILQIFGIFIVPHIIFFKTFLYYIFYLSWIGTFFEISNCCRKFSSRSSRLLKKSIFFFPLVVLIFILTILSGILSFMYNMIIMPFESIILQFTVWMNMMPVSVPTLEHNNYVSGISTCNVVLGYNSYFSWDFIIPKILKTLW